ncbi:MAG TPA: ABC transporter ATP-binding protein [Candidatus Limnocylindria bacterium]|nr:ABC transporter ATP-binding protein [Candidatus Limnocylindria bacterium]
MRARHRYVELFVRYATPERGRVALLGVLLFASIGLQLAAPQLLRSFIDNALGAAPVDALVRIAALFVALSLGQQIVAAFATYLGESVGWAATNALRADLALHCLQLDLGFHKARTPGELIERIDGDVTALAAFFSRFIVNVLGNAVLLAGVLVVVSLEDWRAGLAFTAFVIVAVGMLLGPLRTIAVGGWRRVRESSAQIYGFLGERLGGTEDIRSSGAETHVLNGLALHHRDWLAARRTAMFGVGLIWSSTILTFAVGNAVAFGVGGYLWTIGAISVGTVYLLFYYTELLRRPIESFRRELEEMQRAIASLGRVDQLLQTSSVLAGGTAPLPGGALAVELDGVSFGYDADPVLHDVSLRVAPGRVLGILGRTGGGKTTLARLLLRFYDPTAGTVRLGGVDLRDGSLQDIRSRATLVSQDVQLFSASVRDNLTLFDRTIDDARLLDVAERIGLGPWLRARPGTDPLSAPMTAGSLSAGEAQLLAFARVFLRDPGLVVLDEASSRLDPVTERNVERAIDTLLSGRTAVVIAHRLATVDRCDEIILVEDGRIVEHGARAALAADPGSRFAELLRTGLEPVVA